MKLLYLKTEICFCLDERLKLFSLRLKQTNVLSMEDSDEIVEEDGEIYDYDMDEDKVACNDEGVLTSSPLSPPTENDAGVKISSP